MQNPIISIIVPVYKVEQYLSRCVESILNQTFLDWELILVDDGSPDKCGDICDYYASKDSRVKVIHKENGGLSDARNAGIDIARGNYLAFVDSDDIIHPQMYELLYNSLKKTNSDISECGYMRFEGQVNFDELGDKSEEFVCSGMEALELLIQESKFKIPVWNKLYKRELFSDIRFPKGKIHEDQFTTYKVFYLAKKLSHINIPMYFYFINTGGIMKNLNIEQRFHFIEALKERTEFFKHIDSENLYFSSMEILFFQLLKTRYLILRSKNSKYKSEYLHRINDDILSMVDMMQGNPVLSTLNRKIINLSGYLPIFFKVYDIHNYLLEKKYRIRDFLNGKRGTK